MARTSKKAVARKAVKTSKKAVARKAVKTSKKAEPVSKKAVARKAVPETPVSKKAQVVELLRKGTTASEIMEATGWLRHTTRAYVSVLSRSGFPCTTTLVNNERFYKLT